MFIYLIFLSIVTYSIGRYLFHKIRNLPPTPFPILPIIGHFYLLRRPLHHCLTRLASIHGPVMLLHFGSRRVLVISSLSAAEECITKNDVVFANRPRLIFGKFLGNNYTNLAWSPYGDNWRNLRKIASHEILSAHRLKMLMNIRAEEVELLVKRLAMQAQSHSHAVVDMNGAFFELTLNVLMRMICGKRLLEEKPFREIVKELVEALAKTNFEDYFPLVGKIGITSVANDNLRRLQVKRDKLMQTLIDELKTTVDDDDDDDDTEIEGDRKMKKNKNMIQVLLSLQKREPDYYSDITIAGLMSLLIVAGTETTVSTLEWAMTLLLNHPEVLKKAQAEMNETVGFDRLVTESDLANLPYLDCIIAETFRLYPGAPLGVPHESSDDCFVGGYRVPKETTLFLNLYAIHRDPSLWSEPNKFKPERFEGVEGIRVGYKSIPFGSGRRRCPGENLAVKMVGLTVGVLIQCFEWDRVSHELVDMTEGLGLTMTKAKPLTARCGPRQNIKPLLSQMEVSSVQI